MYNDLIGKKFAYHGRGPDEYDCLGLVIEVLRRNGIKFPDFQEYKGELSSVGHLVHAKTTLYDAKKLAHSEPLAIVTFQLVPRYVTHIGVIIDKYGAFIHVLDGTHVTIENINGLVWKNKVEGFYRWKI